MTETVQDQDIHIPDEEEEITDWLKSAVNKKLELVVSYSAATKSRLPSFVQPFGGVIHVDKEENHECIVRFPTIAATKSALTAFRADKTSAFSATSHSTEWLIGDSMKVDQKPIKIIETFPVKWEDQFMATLEPRVLCLANDDVLSPSDEKRTIVMDDTLVEVPEMVLRTGECLHCGRLSSTQCRRCSSFYCDTMCQRMHWPEHESQCKSGGGGQLVPNHLPQRRTPMPLNLDKAKAIVVSFKNICELWIRLCSHQERFVRFLNEVAEEAAHCDYLYECPVESDVVLYKEHTDSLWYRAEILTKGKVCDDIVRILLLDRGDERRVNWRNLKEIRTAGIVNAPVDLVACRLRGFTSKELSYKADTILQKLVAEETVLLLTNDTCHDLTVTIHGTGESLNRLLATAQVPSFPIFTENYLMRHQLPQAEMPALNDVEMLVTDFADIHLDLVNLAELSAFARIYAYNSQFQSHMPASHGLTPCYTPRFDELVLVQMFEKMPGKGPRPRSRWLRAVGVLNVGDGKARVELIDYGILALVDIYCIRQMSPDLMYPAASHLFRIADECDHKTVVSEMICEGLEEPLLKVIVPRIRMSPAAAVDAGQLHQIYCPNLIEQMNCPDA